ncbi:MAG: hypothetical protein EPN57_07040 [Paraburkholderia sp.]|nr:MAG: hypothetical protein EPN57_07040 [Paraburkholderia sp.]
MNWIVAIMGAYCTVSMVFPAARAENLLKIEPRGKKRCGAIDYSCGLALCCVSIAKHTNSIGSVLAVILVIAVIVFINSYTYLVSKITR